ncbi:MAG: HD domain-containing protein [Xanthomonadales bacterium]|nr:HD domain-containing protein [Xanthomonadales bacterium]
MTLDILQAQCAQYVANAMSGDPAHDLLHVKRVVKNTLHLTDIEEANRLVTVAAAWLHDCVTVAKDSPDRSRASQLAAEAAGRFLRRIDYPDALIPDVCHAIEAHSYSANIEPRSIEAKIVQDADRLEALGAIGIARCFLTAGSMGSALYREQDPFCHERQPRDREYAVDHFYGKLLRLPATMQTAAGKAEAERRVQFMRLYLQRLGQEITHQPDETESGISL